LLPLQLVALSPSALANPVLAFAGTVIGAAVAIIITGPAIAKLGRAHVVVTPAAPAPVVIVAHATVVQTNSRNAVMLASDTRLGIPASVVLAVFILVAEGILAAQLRADVSDALIPAPVVIVAHSTIGKTVGWNATMVIVNARSHIPAPTGLTV